MTEEEIREQSRINNTFNSEELYEPLSNEEEYNNMYSEVEELVHQFIQLTPEFRKIFFDTSKYIIEFDNEEIYNQENSNSEILEKQEEHKKLLENMKNQMIEMSKMLIKKQSSSTEQEDIESSSILTMTQLCKKIKRSDDTIRSWCNQYNDPMPYYRNGKRGQYRFNWEKLSEWNEINEKW